MGKTFLYGQTLEKKYTDSFAKLTVRCQIDAVVRVKSLDSQVVYDVKTDINGDAVFDRMTSGYWDVTLVNVENAPVRRIKIDSLDYAINISGFASTINITYPVGSICVITDSSNTYTAPDTSGSWSFTVYNAGTWTVSCTDGERTISNTAVVSSNGQSVPVTLKYFEATINITYPIGSICTLILDDKTYTAPNTSGSWICTVYNAGTWTVSCTDGERTISNTAVVSYDGQNVPVTLKYFEATINITYTEGCECTCSLGNVTYTAPDTSGYWQCVVPKVGTWLITVIGSNSTKSNTVTINNDGQIIDSTVMLFEAYITVVYPAGSVCTCSDGKTVYYSPDTSGSWICTVYNAGTWTVECQNDTGEIRSSDIQITEHGQYKNADLGEEWITGDIVKDGKTTYGHYKSTSSSNDYLTIYEDAGELCLQSTNYGYHDIGLTNIDFSNAKNLYIEGSWDHVNSGYSLEIYILDPSSSTKLASRTISTRGDYSLNIDVSNINGECHLLGYWTYKGTWKIRNAYIE